LVCLSVPSLKAGVMIDYSYPFKERIYPELSLSLSGC